MNKKLLYVLAFFGVIFIYYLVRSMGSGFSSTVNPNAQVQKAQCVAQCRNNKLSDNCDQYCLQQSLNK